jgi:ABC-type polysaccharide/polyol phosphate transport system ATPase subunit
MDDNVIIIEHLSKSYKLYNDPVDRLKESLHPRRKKYHRIFYALNDISFEVKRGETVGIIGKNGAGKSTLLKILTGVLSPSQGNIEVKGKVSALLELGTGFNPELSGIENIFFSGTIMGFSKTEMSAKLDEIIAFANIGDYINQPLRTYSSGMTMRLGFAIAINIDPDIMFIDEALSVGDVKFQQKCLRKMEEFRKMNKTFLFVTHDTGAVQMFCNRAIWLKDGQIFEVGDPKTVSRHYINYMYYDILPEPQNKAELEVKINSNDVGQYKDVLNLEPNSNDLSQNNGNKQFKEFKEDALLWEEVKQDHTTITGGARIKRVTLYSKNPKTNELLEKVNILEGGESVVYMLDIEINQDVLQPMVGMALSNDRGIHAMHLNSFFYDNKLRPFKKGQRIIVKFHFTMPKFQNGNYSFYSGIVDGTFQNNIPLHQVFDVYQIKIQRTDIFASQAGYIIIDDSFIEINKV